MLQYYSAQQTSLWPLTKIRCCILLIFILLVGLSTSAWATVSRQLHFEWSYDQDIDGLAGFNIYQDGQSISTIYNHTVIDIELDVVLKTNHSNKFTITAFNQHGDESGHSSPYVIDLRTFPSAAISFLLSRDKDKAQETAKKKY